MPIARRERKNVGHTFAAACAFFLRSRFFWAAVNPAVEPRVVPSMVATNEEKLCQQFENIRMLLFEKWKNRRSQRRIEGSVTVSSK